MCIIKVRTFHQYIAFVQSYTALFKKDILMLHCHVQANYSVKSAKGVLKYFFNINLLLDLL